MTINGHPIVGYVIMCFVGLLVIGTFLSLWGAYRSRGQRPKIDPPAPTPPNRPWRTNEDEEWQKLSERVKSLKHDNDKDR